MKDQLLQDQTLGEKLLKKGFWIYFFAFLAAPSGYIIKVLVSNSVSVADVGVLYSIISLVGFLNAYNDLGLTESLQYFLPRYRINKQYNYIKTSIFISIFAQTFTALLISVGLRFSAPWLAEHYFHSPSAVIILKYFCLYFIGINVSQIFQSIFVAFQNTFAFQFVDFIRLWSIVGFLIFFFVTGRSDIERYSLSWIVGLLVGILIAFFLFYKNYRTLLRGNVVLEKSMLREYASYAFWSFLGLNVGQIFGQLLQQMIIVVLGPESAGYYTNFLSLFGIPGLLIGPIMLLIFPLISELVAKKSFYKQKLLYSFFYTYFSIFSFLLACFLIVLGPEIALTLFGEKFIFSGKLLSVGAIFTIFNIFVGFNFSVMAGMGKIKERVKMMGISTIALILLSFIGISLIGIYGAVFALGIGYLLLFLVSFRYIYKDIPFDIDWKFFTQNIVVVLAISLLLWIIKLDIFVVNDAMRYHNLGKLILLGIGFFLVFGLINYKMILKLIGEIKDLRTQ